MFYRTFRNVALAAVCASAVVSLGSTDITTFSSASAATMLNGKPMLEELSKGGYVIYMRHAKTDKSQKDTDVSNLENCATQRNLSEDGKKQAKLIADGLKKYGVAVDKVLSSPYCRAVDTAQIMFGHAEKAPGLRYLTRLNPSEAKESMAWIKSQFATSPGAGKNTILISHTANLKKTTGIWPKKSGDINVFKPNGDGTYTHVGAINAAAWPGLMG